VCVCVCVCVFVCVGAFICMHACACCVCVLAGSQAVKQTVYTHIQTHTYEYTHTHAHTHNRWAATTICKVSHKFSQALFLVSLYCKYTRALTFENFICFFFSGIGKCKVGAGLFAWQDCRPPRDHGPRSHCPGSFFCFFSIIRVARLSPTLGSWAALPLSR
jgi:hypothetical protein